MAEKRPAGRPRRNPARVTTAIRFHPEVHERLHAEADAREVSLNWLVNRIISEGLERLVPLDEIRLMKPLEADDGA